ncbi:carbon-nitrogen hydrolase family protein, partial [mine drainage metagenome]
MGEPVAQPSAAPRRVVVAAIQMDCTWDADRNIAVAERLVRQAAAAGAQIILPPELFQTPYFCIEQDPRHLQLARAVGDDRAVGHFAALARELGVVLPISFFERAGPAYFNSVAVLDADGALLGVYRKSHIPDGPGYQEKYYFSPGDTGLKVWTTRYGRIGGRDLLGSMVSRGRPRHGARRRRAAVLSDGDRRPTPPPAAP